MRRIAVLLLTLVVALGGAACSQSGGSGTEPGSVQTADGELACDLGVDPENRVIRLGLLADLSGSFSVESRKVLDAQLVYWEWLNDRGGVRGWRVEPVVRDSGYIVERRLKHYGELAGKGSEAVVMFSLSSGTPNTLAIAARLEQDSMAAIPHSYYSGWADPEIGRNLFEVFANYCVEAMNAATHMYEAYGDRVAVVTLPNTYGEDSAQGVFVAAESLGMKVVYDGRAAATPGGDFHEVIAAIVQSEADWVWLATDPLTTVTLMQGAFEAGFRGQWSGAGPSWSPWVLSTDAAELVASGYTVSSRTPPRDPAGTPGMQEIVEAMRLYSPDAPLKDVYAVGWVQVYAATAILEEAIASGDLTRAGVLLAANHTVVDFKGLSPDQSWIGSPDGHVVRATYLYEIAFDGTLAGGFSEIGPVDTERGLPAQINYVPDTTVSHEDAPSRYTVLRGPYTSQTARDWLYHQPCYDPD